MNKWERTKDGGFVRTYRGHPLAVKPICGRWRAFIGSQLIGVYASCYEACITVETAVRNMKDPMSADERAIALHQEHKSSRVFSIFLAIQAIRGNVQDPCDDCSHWSV